MEVIVGDCPLGATCEKPGKKDGKDVIIRCPWYVKVEGKNPQSNEKIEDWACAIAWTPILLVNNANEVRKGAAVTQEFRNEVAGVKSNQKAKLVTVPLNEPKIKEITDGRDGSNKVV